MSAGDCCCLGMVGVVPDIAASQVDNDSSVDGAKVSDALDGLQSRMGPTFATGELYITAPSTTPISNVGWWFAANGGSVSNPLNVGWSSNTNGRLISTIDETRLVRITCCCSVSKGGGAAAKYEFALAKNGTRYMDSAIQRMMPNSDVGAFSIQSVMSIALGDEVNLYVRNLTDIQDILFDKLSLIGN